MTTQGLKPTLTGTPQGGVISSLLANLYLNVAFDQWMVKHLSEKPFKRYAADIVVHCKTEKQALYMLKEIGKRLKACKLDLYPSKTKVVNLRGFSEEKYPKKSIF